MEPKPPSADRQRIVARSQLVGGIHLAFLVCLATGVGAAVALLIGRSLNRHLNVSTDIIGYATFHDFNPYVYDDWYYLAVIVLPAIALAVLFALVRLWRHMRWPLPKLNGADHDEFVSAPPHPGSQRSPVAAAASVLRVVTVGLVIGLIVAVARNDADFRVARDAAAIAAAYGGLLAAVVFVSSRSARGRQVNRWSHLARANAVGATLSVLGLLVASQVTQVYVTSDRTVHHYSWLPTWLAILATSAGLILVGWRLRRAGNDAGAVSALERRTVFLVAVPVGLFLLLASLPGPLAQFSSFESGQSLTTLRLVQDGLFPWRDWATTHGVFEDAIQPLFSSTVIQDSNWGLSVGYSMFIVPACMLAMYFLAYRVLGRTWPLLVILGVLFFDPGYQPGIVFLRFAFWPLVLILVGVVIDRRHNWLAALLGGILVAQAVISQETAYCIPAVAVAILGSDAYRVDWRHRGARIRGFAMTFWVAIGGAVVATALVIVLLSQHALGDFARFYTAFVPGHTLTGGIPHLPLTGYYRKVALAPVAAILAAIALLSAKVWLRRPLLTIDWMLAAAAIVTFLYYPKFLDRADLHVYEAFATSVPLLIILVGALLKAVEPLVVRRWTWSSHFAAIRYSVASLLLVAVVLHAPVSLSAVVTSTPSHFRMVTATEPSIPGIGYAAPDAIDPTLVSDLNTFLHAYLRPGDHIFDFTNEPGLLFYLLDFRPSTPYYTVSVAIRQVIQQDLIDKLAVDRPLFVVFAQGETGLPTWDDVPNMVRHYDISQFLLANYRPFADVHGQVIYIRKQANVPDPNSLGLSLASPLVYTDLPFRGLSCDWGYSPNYLSITPPAPPPGHQAINLGLTKDSATSYLLTLPAGQRWDDYHWFEMDAATTFTTSKLQLQDEPPPPGEQRAVNFWTSSSSPNRYRFPIGACSQWPGYGATALHLTMTSPLDIAAVRLLP